MLIQTLPGSCDCPTVPPLPPTITPEPATVVLLGAGLVLLALLAWRRERPGRGAALLGLLLASWGAPNVALARATDDRCPCPPDSPVPPVVNDRDGGGFPGWVLPLGLGAIIGTGWTLGGDGRAATPSDPGAPFGGPLGAAGSPSPVPAPLPVSLLSPAAPAAGDDPAPAAAVRPGAEPVGMGSAPVLAAIARSPSAPRGGQANGLVPPATAQGWAGMLIAGVLAVTGGVGLLLRRRPRKAA